MNWPTTLARLGVTRTAVVVMVLSTASLGLPASAADDFDKARQNRLKRLVAMSFDDLLQATIRSASTRLPSEYRLRAVTLLDQTHIRASGARSLDELLDIYVPGFQFMKKLQANQLGIRGIVSDRNNKLLLLVNGRNMNVTGRDGGALPERDLSMLGDLRSIAVIRGAGSSVYGPGAIAGVISLETYNGLNFQGLEGRLRGGVGEDFAGLDLRFGKKLSDDIGLFAYYGADYYAGADQGRAPLIFSSSFTGQDGSDVIAGEPVPFLISNSNRSFGDRVRHKAHLQLTGELGVHEFDLWLRYTMGGIHGAQRRPDYVAQDPQVLVVAGSGYQQVTVFAEYDYRFNEIVELEAMFSFDIADLSVRGGLGGGGLHWQEHEYLARVTAVITPSESQHAALGFEYSHEIFGKDSWQVDGPSNLGGGIAPGTVWNTDMFSLFGEHKWTLDEHWRTVVGVRADKHTYTPWMWSPRVALVYSPSDSHTLKLIYNRSVRRSDDQDLFRGDQQSGATDETETIDNLEFRYEYLYGASIFSAFSFYFNSHDVVSFDGGAEETNEIGQVETVGLEFELAYRTEASDISFSHNYTQLIDFELLRPNVVAQNISASPYGFGNDLANWSNNITKLAVSQKVGERWSLSGSLRVYWGYPGGRDLADYHADILAGSNNFLPLYDEGVERAFGPSVFLNLGVEWEPIENLFLGVHAFNLLGVIDDDLNKRNHFQRTTEYRRESPGGVFSLRYAAW